MKVDENLLVREALRQINIQMIDSSNLYDGLETLWLGSADESLSNQQVCHPEKPMRAIFEVSLCRMILIKFLFRRLLLNNDG